MNVSQSNKKKERIGCEISGVGSFRWVKINNFLANQIAKKKLRLALDSSMLRNLDGTPIEREGY